MADTVDRQTLQDRVLKALKAGLKPRGFRAFYDGDPALIPQANLPCIIVATVSDEDDLGATGMDRSGEELVIKVVYSKKDDMGSSQTKETTHWKLRQVVKARDDATGLYRDDTIKGILRKNFTLPGEGGVRPLIQNRMRTVYGLQARPEKLITEEAHVTISVAENITITGRT